MSSASFENVFHKMSLYLIYLYKEDLELNGLYPINPNQTKSYISNIYGGARDVIVIVVGNGHSNTSSNPGRD